jgi:hypothetical protein
MSNMLKENDDVNEVDDEIEIVEEDPAKKVASAEDEDEEDQEDERSAKSSDSEDDEREAIRERRRLEKQERKDRRDKAISRDKVEMEFLRKRNDELERRVSAQEQRTHQIDLSQIDVQIKNASDEVEMAERVIAKAVEAGNGADVTQAMRYRDQAMAKVNQLSQSKNQTLQRPSAPQGMDDMTMHHAREFLNENKWYDPQGRDEDSAIMLAIDQSLAKEGYNPQTEDYWDELRYRAARRLPDRFESSKAKKAAPEERVARGGPTVGSGREHAPASTRKEIYVNPERKQALIDAGVWEDPVLRMKYVKRYAEYDKNHKA